MCRYENGGNYRKVMLIRNLNVRETKTGSKYLDLTLSDKDGEVRCKLWSATPEQQALTVGTVVFADFTMSEYNGQLQGVVNSIEETTAPCDMVPSAPESGESLYEELMNEIKEFNDKDLQLILTRALADNHDAFIKCPAAKAVHHAVVGGLAYHTTCMVRSAKALCDVYKTVNKELLIAGCIMHDMAKLKEFNIAASGLVSEYSIEGNLLGHLYMGAEYIHDLCRSLMIPEKTELLLKHMILAHHGQPEYGAVVRPQILEAQLLHQIDDIDAKVYVFNQELDKLDEDQFSEPIFALDRAKIFKY